MERQSPSRARPQLSKLDQGRVQVPQVPNLLARGSSLFPDMGRNDQEPRPRRVEHEREVGKTLRSRRRAVTLMTCEEGRQVGATSEHLLNPRHDSATESTRNLGWLGSSGKSVVNRERMNARGSLHRRHHTEAKKPTVSDDKGPGERRAERDLDVPESLLWKPRPWRERLHTLALALEGLSLDSDHLARSAHVSVTKGLRDCPCRTFLLDGALHSALRFGYHAGRIDPTSSRRLRQGSGGHRAPGARMDRCTRTVVDEHTLVVRRGEYQVESLACFCTSELQARECPVHVVGPKGTTPRNLDQHTADSVIGEGMPNGR